MSAKTWTDDEKLCAFLAVLPTVWFIFGAFHLIPLPAEYAWWVMPWIVTVAFAGLFLWGAISEYLYLGCKKLGWMT